MELLPMVRPAHRCSETGLGSWLWIMVDNSRALRRSRALDGKFAKGRASGLDRLGKLTGTFGVGREACRIVLDRGGARARERRMSCAWGQRTRDSGIAKRYAL